MNFKEKLKQITIVIVISLLLFKLINHTSFFVDNFNIFISIINPFIWAFGIAYLLNPILNYVEKKLKTKRVISILLIYLILFSIIQFIITILTPKIINSINNLAFEVPNYISATQSWINQNLLKSEWLEYADPYVKKNIAEFTNKALGFLDITISHIISKFINATYSLFNAILGIIISIYLLKDKESFQVNSRKLIYSIFSKQKATEIIDFAKLTHKIFSQFIIGKALDSIIIGIICFGGLMILKIKYALIISIIVGVTNMIPYFGPFIGAIPAIIITLFHSPIQALWVALFILLLQQFDGLYLGPKILGNKVGLSPIWIIVAVIIGGGTFGVFGMFLGVPATALIKNQLENFVNKKLKEKDIDPKNYL